MSAATPVTAEATALDEATIERVRVAAYAHFAQTGAAITPAIAAKQLSLSVESAAEAFTALHNSRHFALDDHGVIVLAHPFASRNFGFSVMGADVLWWGGCAWDSFAIPHLVPEEPNVLIATRCPNCDRAHSWTVTTEAPPEGEQRVHFLEPMARVWDDVIHACGNQQIFCDEACIDEWLEKTGNDRGFSFDLAGLWRLASQWYAGRLEPGYVRREPLVAAAYFESVGLTGEFWGTPGK